eukprot:gene22434-28559_t
MDTFSFDDFGALAGEVTTGLPQLTQVPPTQTVSGQYLNSTTNSHLLDLFNGRVNVNPAATVNSQVQPPRHRQAVHVDDSRTVAEEHKAHSPMYHYYFNAVSATSSSADTKHDIEPSSTDSSTKKAICASSSSTINTSPTLVSAIGQPLNNALSNVSVSRAQPAACRPPLVPQDSTSSIECCHSEKRVHNVRRTTSPEHVQLMARSHPAEGGSSARLLSKEASGIADSEALVEPFRLSDDSGILQTDTANSSFVSDASDNSTEPHHTDEFVLDEEASEDIRSLLVGGYSIEQALEILQWEGGSGSSAVTPTQSSVSSSNCDVSTPEQKWTQPVSASHHMDQAGYRFSRDSSDGRRSGGKYFTAPPLLAVEQSPTLRRAASRQQLSARDQTASEQDASVRSGEIKSEAEAHLTSIIESAVITHSSLHSYPPPNKSGMDLRNSFARQNPVKAVNDHQSGATRLTDSSLDSSSQSTTATKKESPHFPSPPTSYPVNLLRIDTTRSPAQAYTTHLAAVAALNADSPVAGDDTVAVSRVQRKALSTSNIIIPKGNHSRSFYQSPLTRITAADRPLYEPNLYVTSAHDTSPDIDAPSFDRSKFSPAGRGPNQSAVPSVGAVLTPHDVLLIRHLSLQGVPLQHAVTSVLSAKLIDPGAFHVTSSETGLFERVTNSPALTKYEMSSNDSCASFDQGEHRRLLKVSPATTRYLSLSSSRSEMEVNNTAVRNSVTRSDRGGGGGGVLKRVMSFFGGSGNGNGSV